VCVFYVTQCNVFTKALFSQISLVVVLFFFLSFLTSPYNARRLIDLQNLGSDAVFYGLCCFTCCFCCCFIFFSPIGKDAVFKSLMFSTDLETWAGLNTDCALKDNICPLRANLRRLKTHHYWWFGKVLQIGVCQPALQIHLVLVQGDHRLNFQSSHNWNCTSESEIARFCWQSVIRRLQRNCDAGCHKCSMIEANAK